MPAPFRPKPDRDRPRREGARGDGPRQTSPRRADGTLHHRPGDIDEAVLYGLHR